MFKTPVIFLLISVLVISGCSGGKEKTEIKVKLSDADYLYNLAGYVKDPTFLAAFDLAVADTNSESKDFLTVLTAKLSEIDHEYRMAAIYGVIEFRDKINFESTNQDVVRVLNESITQARQITMQVLKRRIENACKYASYSSDVSGKTEVSIKELPEKNTYLFTVNRKLDKDRIINLIQTKSDIGFWETYALPEIWDYMASVNNAVIDTLKKGNPASENDFEYSLFRILIPSITQDGKLSNGDVIGVSKISDTALVNNCLAMKPVRLLLPRDLKFMWEKKTDAGDTIFMNLVAIKVSTRDGIAPITGEFIVEAKSLESKGVPVLRMKMSDAGARRLSRFTANNVMRNIVLANNNFIFCNLYLSDAIEGGELEITGNFTMAETDQMAALLNGGPLPAFGVNVLSVN